jgi:methionyl-tRNA formyltransferase
MLMDRGLDTGPILAQEERAISPQDTTGSLTEALSRRAAALLPETVLRWTRGEISPRPQDEAEATYSGEITKDEGEIDWHQPAAAIWRRVRAFQPWPGACTRWRGKRLEIVEAVPVSGEDEAEPGQVVTASQEGAGFGVRAGQGILGVRQVQLEGKRAMPAEEFARGQREFIGAMLPD